MEVYAPKPKYTSASGCQRKESCPGAEVAGCSELPEEVLGHTLLSCVKAMYDLKQ